MGRNWVWVGGLFAGWLVGSAISTVAAESGRVACTSCHASSPEGGPVGPIRAQLERSIHASLDCTDCHAGIEVGESGEIETTQDGKPPAAACGDCHSDEVEIYTRHGRLKVGEDPDLPKCSSCHGSHDILPSTNQQSRTHPRNLPKTCQDCHADVDLLKQHDVLRDEPIRLYTTSAHGRATSTGLFMAATCSDCHASNGKDGKPTAHSILSPSDPNASTYHFNIPQTCGRCHEGTTADYWDGVHGQLLKKGDRTSPVCSHCHGEHGILPVSDIRSPVSPARLAEATCARCHESEALNERYGIPPGRLRSYVDSYHGLKRKAGNVQVANCASCHGSHRILAHTDPRSSIHQDNLQATCGACHPGISAAFAQAPIHESGTGMRTGWAGFFTTFYKWLIGLTIGGMLIHNLGHWVRQVRDLNRVPSVVRMTANETAQHWVLAVSFTVLVISGFSLRFSESWWVHWLFGWGGGQGFVFRGTTHRIAAVLFIVWSVWHVLWLMSRHGRHYLRDMLAGPSDVRHILQSVQYFLGYRAKPAGFGRFSYMEKCEYWALIWGTVIMTATGLLLWFDNWFVDALSLPKGVLDVALVIHYYEAWLAFLAILVWHMYGTVFSPAVYPMNPAWLTGRMPEALYHHEHPEAPPLPVVTPGADASEPGAASHAGKPAHT